MRVCVCVCMCGSVCVGDLQYTFCRFCGYCWIAGLTSMFTSQLTLKQAWRDTRGTLMCKESKAHKRKSPNAFDLNDWLDNIEASKADFSVTFPFLIALDLFSTHSYPRRKTIGCFSCRCVSHCWPELNTAVVACNGRKGINICRRAA